MNESDMMALAIHLILIRSYTYYILLNREEQSYGNSRKLCP